MTDITIKADDTGFVEATVGVHTIATIAPDGTTTVKPLPDGVPLTKYAEALGLVATRAEQTKADLLRDSAKAKLAASGLTDDECKAVGL